MTVTCSWSRALIFMVARCCLAHSLSEAMGENFLMRIFEALHGAVTLHFHPPLNEHPATLLS